MRDDDLVDRIKKAHDGVITVNNGKVNHDLFEYTGFFNCFFSALGIAFEMGKVIYTAKHPEFRKYAKNDVRAIWAYRGMNVNIRGLRSSPNTALKDISTTLKEIEEIARIKNVKEINCSTHINEKIMNRLGYNISTKTSKYSYYIKRIYLQ